MKIKLDIAKVRVYYLRSEGGVAVRSHNERYIMEGGERMFSYKPLWRQLIDKDMNKTKLRELTGLPSATMAKMSRNEYVGMKALDRVCEALGCRIEEVIEHVPGSNNKEGMPQHPSP